MRMIELNQQLCDNGRIALTEVTEGGRRAAKLANNNAYLMYIYLYTQREKYTRHEAMRKTMLQVRDGKQ